MLRLSLSNVTESGNTSEALPSWLIFVSVGEVIYTYAHLLDGMDTNVKELNLGMKDFYWIVVAIATTLMLTVEYIHSRINLLERTTQWHTLWRWTAYFAFAFIIFLLGAFGVENFIYIQF